MTNMPQEFHLQAPLGRFDWRVQYQQAYTNQGQADHKFRGLILGLRSALLHRIAKAVYPTLSARQHVHDVDEDRMIS
jgi:hypothetical protein